MELLLVLDITHYFYGVALILLALGSVWNLQVKNA